jgi:hypothetical protein
MSEQLPTESKTPEPAAPNKDKDAPLTRYVILQRDDSGFWSEVAIASARSSEAAIRDHGKEGTYLAISARRFKPVTVKAETKTVLKLGEAT